MKVCHALPAVILAAVPLFLAATEPSETPFTRKKRVPAQTAERYGSLPLGAVIRTDERYGTDPLIQGPRGWDYWNRLESPTDDQNPNLWGDKRPTYFVGQLKMPPGTRFTMRGHFPRARYFKIALYRFERNTFIALGGEDLAAWDIVPDPGSANPYRAQADRTTDARRYTAHVITEDPPEDPADRVENAMYAGRGERSIQIVFRIYVSDEGYDGAGLGRADVPGTPGSFVTYDATLADGTRLSGEQVVERFAEPLGSPPPPLGIEPWYALIQSGDNDPRLTPATAPAREEAPWEIFRGIRYSVVGAFQRPDERAKIELQTEMEAGGDPTTVYMLSYLSRAFGPVYVFRAKMPTFPDTYAGAETMADGQVKYWSVVTAASAPSGELWDGVFDMQVPLDEDGFYTIVVSRPEDRPESATHENGVTWIDWGPGEGLDDPRDREDWGMLLMRFMVCHPDWENSPAKVRTPGTAESVMGPYFPKGYYTTAAEFDAARRGKSLKPITVPRTRDMRFGEILVVKKTGIEVYNTTGSSDCAPALWDGLDPLELKEDLGALGVQLNGPKFWMMDEQTLSLGEEEHSFGGIKARLAAILDPALAAKAAHGTEPYTIFTPKKTQRMVYSAGKPVFELVDPEGYVYILQAHAEQFTLESLPELGAQMDLPEGWHYRSRILEKDLALDLGPAQTIYAVGDEFHQYYTRLTGPE